jgi:hypothetical protein
MPSRLFARRGTLAFATLAAALACAGAAHAEGMTTVTQSDGSTQTYAHVRMRLDGTKLFLTSPNGKDVLEITTGACSFPMSVERCLPYDTVLHRDGHAHPIALIRGALYFNTTTDVQHLPHSTQVLAPGNVVVHLHTMRGTLISAQGRLDNAK